MPVVIPSQAPAAPSKAPAAASVEPELFRRNPQPAESVGGAPFSLGSPNANKRTRLPKVRPNAPFFLAVHPESWGVRFGGDGEAWLLPSWRQIKATAGVNGVSANRAGVVNWRPAVASAQDEGWYVIPHEMGPGGVSYLTTFDVELGTFYGTCFDSLYPGTDQVTCDRAALAAWVSELRRTGEIPGPSIEGLRRLREGLVVQQLHLATIAGNNATAVQRSQMIARSIETIGEEMQRRRAPANPIHGAPTVM